MKRVKKATEILYKDIPQEDGPVTWKMFNEAITGLNIEDGDVLDIGQDYSYSYDGETEKDGYSISIMRKEYETDEEEKARLGRELAGKIEYQKRLAEQALESHNRAMAEHERLKALFNPIPKR